MRKYSIKASSITNLTDARYFAAQGVDFITFNINPESENFVPMETILEFKKWISGPRMVLECGDLEADTIIEIAEKLQIDCIEINFDYNVDAFHNYPFTIFEKVILTDEKTFDEVANRGRSAYKIIDCVTSGFTYEKVLENDWHELFYKLSEICPIFIEMQIDKNYLADALQNMNPYGIQISGSSENKIGEKNYELIDAIFDSIEQCDS